MGYLYIIIVYKVLLYRNPKLGSGFATRLPKCYNFNEAIGQIIIVFNQTNCFCTQVLVYSDEFIKSIQNNKIGSACNI